MLNQNFWEFIFENIDHLMFIFHAIKNYRYETHCLDDTWFIFFAVMCICNAIKRGKS